MAYIRLVHPSEYDSVLGEFTDLAFKKSSGSGMSVIERACAEAASGGVICAHIAQFYAGIAGDPVVFCFIEEAELPPGSTVIPTLSDTGDECHREVDGVGNKAIKRHFKPRRGWQHFKICEHGQWRDVTLADTARFGKLPGQAPP